MKSLFENKLARLTIYMFVGGAIVSPTINGYWSSNISPVIPTATTIIGVSLMIYGVIQAVNYKK